MGGKVGLPDQKTLRPLMAQAQALQLVNQGRDLALTGAIAKFEEALALDPSLSIELEAEAQRIYAEVLPIAPGETVTGTVEVGAPDIWRYDGAASITVTIDMVADDSPLASYLSLVAPDGSIITKTMTFPAATRISKRPCRKPDAI